MSCCGKWTDEDNEHFGLFIKYISMASAHQISKYEGCNQKDNPNRYSNDVTLLYEEYKDVTAGATNLD